ncbi:hypothetical protein [Anaerotignum lactatifermentans]|uniref:hypothetical protein n=1 Tax=Anaerotignum lactatifermentans TaxID=160404 RepID=UPI00255CB84C|nr:hypothetical protein [Anaerotignum lactatifermentans]
MIYAMVLKNRVIGIIESETPPKWGNDERGNEVSTIETTEETDIGMIYNEATESFEEYIPPEPQPTQLDRIETAMNKTLDEIRAEGAAAASVNLMSVGAEMTKVLAAAKMDVPATAGTFAKQWDEWTADEKTALAKSLWQYKGIGYQARMDIQKIEVYAPDVATNNYAVRPIPDVNGIFPGVLNMDVSIGMKVRDWEDGKVYICYANPITSLQWAPHNVPASFELYEG